MRYICVDDDGGDDNDDFIADDHCNDHDGSFNNDVMMKITLIMVAIIRTIRVLVMMILMEILMIM